MKDLRIGLVNPLRMNSLRKPVSPNPRFVMDLEQPKSPERQRIEMLEASIQSIRPSRVASEPPPVLDAERNKRLVLVLAELALRQALVGDTVVAKRTVGDAVVVLEEVTDEMTLGIAQVLIGEALIAADAPHHAQPRLARATEICTRLGGTSWAIRAKVGLGRALVMLDDGLGAEIQNEVRGECEKHPSLLAQVDETLRRANTLFDTPRSVKTGYGRPVSFYPKPMR